MHKPEMINFIAEQLDVSKENAKRYLDAVLDQITFGLDKYGEVNITGFGSFKTRDYAARQGVNPKTRETINIDAGKRVIFKPGKNLKDAVNS